MTAQNPESILIKQEQPTIEGLAREHAAKQGLKHYYQVRARQLGLSLHTYCERFNVKGGCMSNIDKQALREAAERAESDIWGFDRDEFNEDLTPSTVLALLDELEAVQKVSAARLEAIDTTHKMFQRERDRAAAAEKRSSELSQKADIYDMLRQDYELHGSLVDFVDWQAKRIADQRETLLAARSYVMQCARIGDAYANGVLQAIDRAAAGKGVI